ncbi:O-antigen ligase family protein [Brumimicrobium aurantiacum]|uniref:O-antigen ligase family protein n=1 Tax=Brumimicrobium aurantiacum TaxID=1737063 RepID=A0A3E1F2E9_9FLAO|nr:O-antigen ligase family protein [Brumimicrobium aurantiacum]RFC55960.1 O-antigen ligase family protein [Brumimicrobium aurantiacum]
MTKSRLVISLLIVLLAMHLLPLMYFTGIFTLLIFLFVLTQGNLKERITLLVRNKSFWMLLIPFLIYALSMATSEDLHSAWKSLEIGISLLIFPIIIGLIKIERKDIIIFLKSLVFLVAFLPVLGFIQQYFTYLEVQDTGLFYNDNLVSILDKQAVYYGFFINVALLTLFILWKKGEIRNTSTKILGVTSFILLVSTQYLLASRIAIALTVLMILAFAILFMISFLNRIQVLIFATGFIVLAFVMLFSFPKVLKRFQSIQHVEYRFDNPNPINHFNGEIKKENWNGLNTRLAIWECSIDAIQLKPIFGHGIGDGQQELYNIYEDKNFILAKSSNYNTHNQYLHFALIGGIIGFLAYLGHLLYFLRISLKKKHWLLFGFIFIYLITGLTENILGRNQGVVFISLTLSILVYFSPELSKKIKQ